MQPAPHVVRPPARRARRLALGLSVVAVAFSLACGFSFRRALSLGLGSSLYEPASLDDPQVFLPWVMGALCLLLVALLLRMGAAICELLWLERTWTNLPEHLRSVGPVEKVTSVMLVGLSVVPGISWAWKLGLVLGIVDGFEEVRARVPFRTELPRRLGVAAVIIGWVPGLNLYVAPFLWEMFATRIDAVCGELLGADHRS
jgi:hypothetical protein